MISIGYFIVCVNLLYSFVQAETLSPLETRKDGVEPLLSENEEELLANLLSPYRKIEYKKQLSRKQNLCSIIVEKIQCSSDNLKNSTKIKCRPIVPSPITKAYRNRDIFQIRHGVDGNIKTVGCIVKNLSPGLTYAVHPTKVVTIRESHKKVAQVYEDFIRLSVYPPHLYRNDQGYWGRIIVRSNEAGDVMASITVQPIGFTSKMIEKQTQALKKYFLKHLPNITLYQQQCSYSDYLRCTNEAAPFVLLYGKPYLQETLNGYKFKILPYSYFQVNKLGAEVYYNTIVRAAELKPNSTVIDVCSGTGTTSIMSGKLVKEVIGIDSNPQVVTDSTLSAMLNNVRNVKFIFGRAEEMLHLLLESLNDAIDIVPILDSGYGGLGLNVVEAIRKCSTISRVLFISSKTEFDSDIQNCILLCSSKNTTLPPFRLTKATPVDLIPQTANVELVLLFKR